MVDPFRTISIRERTGQIVGLAVLIAFIGAISYLFVRPDLTGGRSVEAELVRVGTYSASGAMGGDLPILTVRLPDGSIRQVRLSWAAASNCIPGRWISLLQRGSTLQVGRPGCKTMH
jgi:hypothetical protein